MELRSPTRTALRLPPAAMLVVAGVPGAGDHPALAGERRRVPGLDPEPIRARYGRRLGRLPYRL